MTVSTFTTAEQKASYVAGAESALEDARMALKKAVDGPKAEQDAAWSDYRQAMEHVKHCRLDVYGVPCIPCDGTGVAFSTDRFRSWDCGVCAGEGKVLPEVAARMEDGPVERDPDEWHDSRFDREGA